MLKIMREEAEVRSYHVSCVVWPVPGGEVVGWSCKVWTVNNLT